MTSQSSRDLEELAWGYALLNAVEHGGKAAVGPVMGKIMAARPDLRPRAREVAAVVRRIVEEVNSLSLEEQKRLLEEKYSWVIEAKPEKSVEEKRLPPLPGAEPGKVVTRFAPNPDFVIHLGNARPAILSHEYARLYKGRMILRFEDTDPRIKTPLPEAYELIRRDLSWLGVEWDEEYIQSLRMEIYYEIARKLIEKGAAYVDDRPAVEFRSYRDRLDSYPPRLRSVEENMDLWDSMLEGRLGEGEAVLRVKTDPRHPDPSVRDWVAFRIIDTDKHPHPVVGSRYTVWPTYNFAAGVDDHLMGVTHILRAKEHMQNTVKQRFLYDHLGWSYPHVVHFGRLRLEGFIMSKSLLKSLLERGLGDGLDDPRFATIAGLRRRGITAEAIKRIMVEVGVKHTDASISYANLAAANRVLVDPKAVRLLAVLEPVEVIVEGLPWSGKRVFRIPFHPGGGLGEREVPLEGPSARLLVSREDLELLYRHRVVRLVEAFNIEIASISKDHVRARFHSESLEEAKKLGAPIIQWVPSGWAAPLELLVPEGLELLHRYGYVEKAGLERRPGEIVQFMRVGFARIEAIQPDEKGKPRMLRAVFAHE